MYVRNRYVTYILYALYVYTYCTTVSSGPPSLYVHSSYSLPTLTIWPWSSCRGCAREDDHEKVLADLAAHEDKHLGGYRLAHLVV